MAPRSAGEDLSPLRTEDFRLLRLRARAPCFTQSGIPGASRVALSFETLEDGPVGLAFRPCVDQLGEVRERVVDRGNVGGLSSH